MNKIFAATAIEKNAEEDNFEKGCSGNSRCILFDKINLTANSFAKLVDLCFSQYGIEKQPINLNQDQEEVGVQYFMVSQLETDESYTPSEMQLESWRKGDLKLYLADYTFSVEVRTVDFLKKEDLVGVEVENY